MPALINTMLMTAFSLVIATPLGIFAAIWLVEYAKRGSKLVKVVRITTETLQGIPSIVYGLFGMLFFVMQLKWGYSLIAGAFTLAIMVLPVIMRTTEEALTCSAGFLPRGQLRPGRGQAAHRIHHCAAQRHAALRLRQVHLLKTLNRMNDLVPRAAASRDERCRGLPHLAGRTSIRQDGCQPSCAAGGHGVPEANPFPMSIYDNIAYGPRTHGVRSKAQLDEMVERSLRGAAIWDEVKDRLKKSALGLSGGQQQRLCIARALAVEPEGAADGRAHQRPGPHLHLQGRGAGHGAEKNYTIVIVTHNMQQAARISDKTAFFLLGELVEMGPTERVFTTPVDKRTEDYISGRFG